MDVLIACEFSGIVREEFRKLGHNAYSCDLLPADDYQTWHIQGDVREIILKPIKERNDVWWSHWDLMIAHPPCTYLSNSGVSWLYKQPERWGLMRDGAEFFKELLNADIPKICVENPIQHKYAKEIIGQNYTQIIQPYMFGHTEQKATCLWLKNLPQLKETNNVKEEMLKLPKKESQRLHYLPPSKDRWKLRSTTYRGIAKAMAEQWSNL